MPDLSAHPRRQSSRLCLTGIILLSGFLLSACTADRPEHLRIGTLLPITGDLSQYGGAMQDAARLLVDQVNGCGGVVGQPVELIAEDDQTEPAAGASAMTKLVEVDRVAGVVGASSSAVSEAALGIAVRNQVVMISPSSTSPVFTERSRQGDFQGFWFRTAPPDTFQGRALAELAKAQGFQTVSILAINNNYGSGLVAAFIPAFKVTGGKILNEAKPTRYPPDASTFETEVQLAFRGNPDAVLLIGYLESGSIILKTAYQQGLLGQRTQVFTTDGMKDGNLATQVGRNPRGKYIATGILGTAPNATGPALQEFRQRYTTAYKREPGIFVANTWDATALLVLAAESAKSTTGATLRQKVREVANAPGQEVTDVCQALALIRQGQDINFQGASSTLEMDAQGDVVGNYDLWQVSGDGTLKILGQVAIGTPP